MKRVPRRNGHPTSSKAKPPAVHVRYVCCECNAAVSETNLHRKSFFSNEGNCGHEVVEVRPIGVAFLQGLGWGLALMVGGAVAALSIENSRFTILAASGAICSALACRKMLEGLSYLNRAEPAKNVARQRISEAAGAWIAVLVSTLVASR